MPDTLKEMGYNDPNDPRQAVFAGAKYLSQLLTKYNGDIEKALVAYNWGMGHLDEHMEYMSTQGA